MNIRYIYTNFEIFYIYIYISGIYSTKLKEYFLFIRTNNLFKKLYNESLLLEKMCNRIFATVLLMKDIL